MNMGERAARYRLDFMTNPAYTELVEALREQHRKEMKMLQAVGREEAAYRFNHQSGVVDGIERCLLRIEQMEKEAKEGLSAANDADTG